MKKDLVLFGIQGSGKGTQAKIITKNNPDIYSYFSSGDLFRALTKGGDNAIGNYVKHRIENWLLINDTVTNTLFQAYMHTVLDDNKYMLLDGYPRTINQLDDIFRLMDEQNRPLQGIQFDIPDEVAIARMMGRGRNDDTPEAIKLRIAQYYEKTEPVITYFAQHADLIKIDATMGIDDVAAAVAKTT